MRETFETNDSLSLFAGAWFAVASCIPVIFLSKGSLNSYDSFTAILWYAVAPILTAFFFGFCLGSDILNQNKVKSSKDAVFKGVKVALLSYVFFALFFALYVAFYQTIFERNPHEWLTVDFAKNLLFGFVIVGFFGSITVGWLVLIVGAIAGWLLFKYKLPC